MNKILNFLSFKKKLLYLVSFEWTLYDNFFSGIFILDFIEQNLKCLIDNIGS